MHHLHTQGEEIAIGSRVRQQLEETAELRWWKTSDQVEHPVRVWTAKPQSAVVLYFHGIEGHGRWFEETALALNKYGISVYAPDRRGAGSSREERGHASSWKRLVQDADEMLARVRDENPGTPVFVIANCWGSKVALTSVAKPQNNFVRGIALTSPAVCVQVDVSLPTKLRIGLSLLLNGGRDLFDVPLTPEHFTDVPEFLEYIRTDELRLTKASAAFFVESLKLTRQCKTAAKGLAVPLLVLQSGRDEIVNVVKIKKWFQELSLSDKTLSMFPEAAHSLDFDPQMEAYQQALADWILARIKAPALNGITSK